MEIIKVLGKVLSHCINISPLASRGLLKLAIKDELGPFIAFKELIYQDLKKVIRNSLRERLKKLGVQEKRIETIIKQLGNALSENQSLIIMEKA